MGATARCRGCGGDYHEKDLVPGQNSEFVCRGCLCPFCPLLLPGEPERWDVVGSDFHGEPSMILGIRSCGYCECCIGIGAEEEDLVRDLAQPIASFFTSLSGLMDLCAIDQPIEDWTQFEIDSASYYAEVYFPEGGIHIMFIQEYVKWSPAMSYTDDEAAEWYGSHGGTATAEDVIAQAL